MMILREAPHEASGRFEMIDSHGIRLAKTRSRLGNAKYAKEIFASEINQFAQTYKIDRVLLRDGREISLADLLEKHSYAWERMLNFIEQTGYNGTPE